VSFVAITLYVASQRVFIVVRVYFIMTQSGNFWICPRIPVISKGTECRACISPLGTSTSCDSYWGIAHFILKCKDLTKYVEVSLYIKPYL
jgi:hypothetical protein